MSAQEKGGAALPLPAVLRRTGFAALPLVALVAATGALAALAVRAFEAAVEHLFAAGHGWLPAWLGRHGWPPWLAHVAFPTALGLLVAGAKALVPPPDRLHSVPLVIVALQRRGGRLRPLSTLLKTVGAILTLGAGGSLGREGPVVLLGGGVGSALGQALRLRAEWVSTLVAAGAGAAVATAFSAPITGTLFVLEIVLIQFSSRAFALVALACAAAAQVSHLLEGAPPFPIPAYRLASPWEVPLYLGLGLAVACLARLYIRVLYGAEDLGDRLPRVPAWVRPALGGVLFGALGVALPATLGGGYGTIAQALAGQLPAGTLMLLLAGKLLAIALTSGGGWPGGVFTPALFLGAMAGGAYGQVAAALLPGVVAQPGAYAVVGMAAMIAGATHAPLTALTLIFEVTRDYQVALPAMVGCGAAAVFSQRLSPYSVDTLHLPDHGILLPWQVADLREVRVGDVMRRDVHTLHTGMLLADAIAAMQQHRHGGYPVLDEEGRLVGMLTLGDIRAVPLEGRLATPVAAAMSRRLVTATPGESLAAAALRMARHGIGRLPVVDPDDPARLVGIVTRSDVLRTYAAAARDPAGAAPPEAFLER